MTLIQIPSLGLGPGTAAKPERGLGRDQKRALTRKRHEAEAAQTPGILQCFRAFGKGEGAKHHVF